MYTLLNGCLNKKKRQRRHGNYADDESVIERDDQDRQSCIYGFNAINAALFLYRANLHKSGASAQSTHLVLHLVPDMMYDSMLLQHNKVILNWLHNATKMPCQYLLLCQYNKVLPLLY